MYIPKSAILSIILLFLPSCLNQSNLKKPFPSSGKQPDGKPVELIHTDQELAESSWERWTNKKTNEANFAEIVQIGLDGDRGALYLTGLCFLMGGNGITIDVQQADHFFSYSASLGFAPALDQLRSKYIHETPNPFLVMVYINLCIAQGHKEYVATYHKLRNDLLKKKEGLSLIREIERVATKKMELIAENQKKLNETPSHEKFTLLFLDNVAKADNSYDQKYWAFFVNSHQYLEDNGLKNVEDFNFGQRIIALEIIRNLFEAVENTKNKISETSIKKYIEKRLQILLKTKEGRIKAIEEMKELNRIPIIEYNAAKDIIKDYPTINEENFKRMIKENSSEEINSIIQNFHKLCNSH